MEITLRKKMNRFWDYKLNSHTGYRDYPYNYIAKAEKEKKLSKQKTIEKRRLRDLEKLKTT